MARDNGGVIGVLNTPTSTTASGVWALQDQYEAKRNGNWPLTPFVSPNSARFNSGSSDYLNRTPASAGNRKTWTWSSWIKRSNISTSMPLFSAGTVNTTTNYGSIYFLSTDELRISDSSNLALDIKTNAKYRDVSAWYHIVIVMDTAQATSSNRVKFYVNGEQVTSLATATYPSQNAEFSFNNNVAHNIARDSLDGTPFFNGYLSETYFIDGQALTPSSFGASNASGVWYPIPYSGSYGNNGFYLKFGNASSLGTDSSPNGNNWTVNNLTSVDQSTDSPLNNFCTLGGLVFSPKTTGGTYSDGNLTVEATSSDVSACGNFAVTTGKWYWETKIVNDSSNTRNIGITITNLAQNTTYGFYIGSSTSSTNTNGTIGYSGSNGYIYQKNVSGTQTSVNTSTTFATGDIIGTALDMTNGTITFYKNGTQVTNTPVSLDSLSEWQSWGVLPAYRLDTTDPDVEFSCNFGSPPYAANSYADGNGYGNFSYAVPSGYYALCTANLNTYG